MKETEREEENRRAIRFEQQKELLFIFYYVWFAIEYIVRVSHLLRQIDIRDDFYIEAYYKVSLVIEQERRKRFSFWPVVRRRFEWLRYL